MRRGIRAFLLVLAVCALALPGAAWAGGKHHGGRHGHHGHGHKHWHGGWGGPRVVVGVGPGFAYGWGAGAWGYWRPPYAAVSVYAPVYVPAYVPPPPRIVVEEPVVYVQRPRW